MKEFKKGLAAGLPIGIGYLAVSVTFGILAVSYGLTWWEATLISMTNLTSAGQFAGIKTMVAGGTLLEMSLVQAVINLRYALMSISLSQKAAPEIKGVWKWFFGAFHTDEIFAVAVGLDYKFGKKYFLGLIIAPFIGWSAGTFLGAILGNFLPKIVLSSLGVALYGMFIAIFVPKMKEGKNFFIVVVIALLISSCFAAIPLLKEISSGFAVIISAVIASALGALCFPIKEEKEQTT